MGAVAGVPLGDRLPEHRPAGADPQVGVYGTRVGYARCSTDEQDLIIQTEQLLALGVLADRIYIDRGFSGTTRRYHNGR
ncbi:hypothetical protein Airi02_048890 [Actinoallomurus iriomotensis]|uniref:Resolvase/invertase-type recombinase catalytic domain-containing protein n=1 Tax=Actinoallomurus iriomotensis TaxID=478107 RepID=A0A9W6W0I8_9ACTN|nr:hypothetical protein Airi02_048890 [Actinoallomurus iriomotensis]